MFEFLPASWRSALAEVLMRPELTSLREFVERAYRDEVCYPSREKILAAFQYCDFSEIKVVILGQDPYHGPGQANGLAFSVYPGVLLPPSLVNIFKELEQSEGKPIPFTGDLSGWASQGVLLLNTVLSVAAGRPKSHANKGWEFFTDAVIQVISTKCEHVVFLLWGGDAQKKRSLIDADKHCILVSGHPSPLSANRGYWFGNRHFGKANAYLVQHGKAPISW